LIAWSFWSSRAQARFRQRAFRGSSMDCHSVLGQAPVEKQLTLNSGNTSEVSEAENGPSAQATARRASDRG